jgi:hypothetical protein
VAYFFSFVRPRALILTFLDLGDFGLSVGIADGQNFTKVAESAGTPPFVAPGAVTSSSPN